MRIIIILLFFVNLQYSQEYFVCGNSDKYHLDSNCKGLKNCKKGITKINDNQIFGKTICGFENEHETEKSIVNHQFSGTLLNDQVNPDVIICGNSSKYHFNENCEGLKNCKSKRQIVKLEVVMNTKDLCQFESNNLSSLTYPKESNSIINFNYILYALVGSTILIFLFCYFKKLNEKNFKKFENIINVAASNDFNSLIFNLSQNKIKHKELENDNHYHFMIESIKKAKNEIVITSGWITKSVVNKEFIRLLEKRLKEGIKILIVYGYRYKGKHNNSSFETIHELENICKKYSNFQIKNGSKTKGNHSKCLIIDNQYIAVTSYNWLSSGINVKNREKGVVIFDEKFAEKERNFFYSI